jgi:hypothetical protein
MMSSGEVPITAFQDVVGASLRNHLHLTNSDANVCLALHHSQPSVRARAAVELSETIKKSNTTVK